MRLSEESSMSSVYSVWLHAFQSILRFKMHGFFRFYSKVFSSYSCSSFLGAAKILDCYGTGDIIRASAMGTPLRPFRWKQRVGHDDELDKRGAASVPRHTTSFVDCVPSRRCTSGHACRLLSLSLCRAGRNLSSSLNGVVSRQLKPKYGDTIY